MARLVVSSCGRSMCTIVGRASYCSQSFERLIMPQLTTSKDMVPGYFEGCRSLKVGIRSSWQAQRKFSVYSSVQPGSPPPSPPPSGHSSLGKWILGIIITVIIPFLTSKWTKLLKFKDEVETVVKEVEQEIERVEDVAEAVDNVAKDVSDHLPKGGKLRDVAEFVEEVAEEIVKDAHLAENLINKVENLEDKKSMVEEVNNNQTKDVTQDQN